MRIFQNGAIIAESGTFDQNAAIPTLGLPSLPSEGHFALLAECPFRSHLAYVIADALFETLSTSGCRNSINSVLIG